MVGKEKREDTRQHSKVGYYICDDVNCKPIDTRLIREQFVPNLSKSSNLYTTMVTTYTNDMSRIFKTKYNLYHFSFLLMTQSTKKEI